MTRRIIPRLRAMPPISGPACSLAVRAGFAGAGGVGWDDPGADDAGA
jgi:hypothetical protein